MPLALLGVAYFYVQYTELRRTSVIQELLCTHLVSYDSARRY